MSSGPGRAGVGRIRCINADRRVGTRRVLYPQDMSCAVGRGEQIPGPRVNRQSKQLAGADQFLPGVAADGVLQCARLGVEDEDTGVSRIDKVVGPNENLALPGCKALGILKQWEIGARGECPRADRLGFLMMNEFHSSGTKCANAGLQSLAPIVGAGTS
jgi:hypothetical protein